MNKVVLFGVTQFSSLAWYALKHDSPYDVVGFTVDRSYYHEEFHEDLPVAPFEDIQDVYAPDSVSMLLPLGFHSINGLRRKRYEQALAQGYLMTNYVSSRAITWPSLNVQKNCLIYEGAVVQPFSRVGQNVIIRSNAHISHHCEIGDHVFIAAGVTLGGNVVIGEQSFVGLGAVVRDGVTIAERCFIGAGAVVITDTEADGVYVGNPARKIKRTSLEVTTGLLRGSDEQSGHKFHTHRYVTHKGNDTTCPFGSK
ncbi:hypothetical protein BOW53_07850 [Solemya pervernicosa gill symbiont]|uniref:Transferase n=1 Tax=Solemya pervernicosa gill symbiont TaxID=642797 RepID=A0A1T2L5I2_9GAMM|nr:acetyltransferase [Solemya pervernicosa gill symbiont]OOZ40378.1 hypothetical protein BOW53_07850 [Solemya pervernicosa gill symbiont]